MSSPEETIKSSRNTDLENYVERNHWNFYRKKSWARTWT